MSSLVDELFHRLACETPLPRSRTASRTTNTSSTAKPYTRAQARIEQRARSASGLLLQPTNSSKKRVRKPEFGIFVDADAANEPFLPSPKKFKPNERLPLTVRHDSANVTPVPSPRHPCVPFPFSPGDPLWENNENYNPRPCYATPPSTPRSLSPAPSPSPQPSPHYRSARAPRPRQSQRACSHRQLSPPRDLTLYKTLGINTWQATTEEIRAAHHRYAREHHPDKVAPEQREEATHLMQIANAAAEVLLDDMRRREYHKSGRLPWLT
ncbi:hypothetical protein E8E12_000536 [Didymella heteroderae]|uniref:J domain-containing protein n=1 Tax=Didymella heteroderae TaxID=1769908 RepID=A0A9P4WGX3_9PLEO|nr:hypothetical protein E8E12_000536 [Didymella heteroderae]